MFGFSYTTALVLLDFLRRHRAEIRHLTGVRYSGELGRPFHVVDDDMVVLPQDHPFAPGGRFASLLIPRPGPWRKAWPSASMDSGRKAMKDLREISFQPMPALSGRRTEGRET